jgi:hypothetical protein
MKKIILFEEFINESRITYGAEEIHDLGNMPKKEFATQHKGEGVDIFFTKDGKATVSDRKSNLIYHGKDAAKSIKLGDVQYIYAGLEDEFYKPEDWVKLLNSVYKGKRANVHGIIIAESLNEGFTKDKLLKLISKLDDAIITVKGKKYTIYNPDNGNDDNTAMWGTDTIKALNSDGDEFEFKYSDIQDFSKDFDESIDEAKAGRAWEGKIKNIDNLLSWMYDKGIMGKGDMGAKDSLFRQYYRYYNDGDFPGSLKSRGFNSYMPAEKIAAALEELIEDYIKKILSKYSGKFTRSDFHYDMLLKDLNLLKDLLKREDVYALINYWTKEIDVKDTEFQALLQQLKEEYKIADEAANKKLATLGLDMKNTGISYRKQKLEDEGQWEKSESVPYTNMATTMRKMTAIIEDVVQAAKRAKGI